MATLKTDYTDEVLNASKNKLRKYQQITNDDGTVSFVDVTDYTTVGSELAASNINAITTQINTNTSAISTLNESLTNVSALFPVTESGSTCSRDYKKGEIFKTESAVYICNVDISKGTNIQNSWTVGYTSPVNIISAMNQNIIVRKQFTTTTNSGGGFHIQNVTGIKYSKIIAVKPCGGNTEEYIVILDNGFAVVKNSNTNAVVANSSITFEVWYIN